MVSTALVPFAVSAQGFAQRVQSGVDAAGTPAGLAVATPGGLFGMIGRVINVLLSLIGIVLLVVILYSGFLWMTAGGDSKKVTEARGRIMNAVFGLVIVVSAYAIAGFVLQSIATVQGGATVR